MERYDIIPLATVEKNAILAALSFTFGNKELAAKLLRISRSTLYRKLEEYKIPEDLEARKELENWLMAQRELAELILNKAARGGKIKEVLDRAIRTAQNGNSTSR